MAILRAGPFASSTESFLDEPATPTRFIYPVNCAMDTSSSNWPWKHLYKLDSDDYYFKDGLPEDNQSKSNPSQAQTSINAYWTYQAAAETSFDLTYDLQASGDGPRTGVRISVKVGEVVVFTDSEEDSNASISGTETINLPESVVPNRVWITASSDAFATVTASGSIEYTVSQ